MIDMDTIQIATTNACVLRCGNCTHLSNSAPNYYMTLDQYKRAIDSLAEWPAYHNKDYAKTRMVGMIGGEVLLHKDFEKQCEYAKSVIGQKHLGLWTTFPEKFSHYRNIICDTFEYIFLNDHSRGDIMHGPVLVAADEIFPKEEDKGEMNRLISNCWLQQGWSASITPKGAFFCEVAAELSWLFNGPDGWPVEPGWWKTPPWKYGEQIEFACKRCGVAMPLAMRPSIDERDDISPKNLLQLKVLDRDKKVKRGDVVESDCKLISKDESRMNVMGGGARYKDNDWRNVVAAKYGMFLEITQNGFWKPHLKKQWTPGKSINVMDVLTCGRTT